MIFVSFGKPRISKVSCGLFGARGQPFGIEVG
jgi:hypothetical protein